MRSLALPSPPVGNGLQGLRATDVESDATGPVGFERCVPLDPRDTRSVVVPARTIRISSHAGELVHERFGTWRLRLASWSGLGIVVEGLDGEHTPPADYVNEILLTPAHREQFFSLIDRVGLVVCKAVGGDGALHRDVRGRSSRGRLSQGVYFHHDGCSGPVQPRVVEIRCPYQEVARHTFTAIAPFPEVIEAMLLELPAHLRIGELADARAAILADGPIIGVADLQLGPVAAPPVAASPVAAGDPTRPLADARDAFIRDSVAAAAARNGRDRAAAAPELPTGARAPRAQRSEMTAQP